MARALFLASLLALTLARWSAGFSPSLSPQECYLALCGAQPAAAYFEGPPGTALCVAGGVLAAGASGLSLLWPLFAVAATLAFIALVAPIAGRNAAYALAALLNLLPAFNSASLAPSAALPAATAALAFMACVWRALQNPSVFWWLGAGLCAAAGAMFSYLAWMLWPAALVLAFSTRRWRAAARSPALWLATIPSLLVLAAQLGWNTRHGWVHFIGGTWETATTFHRMNLPAGVWSAALAVSPLALAAIATGCARCLVSLKQSPKARFLGVPALLAAGVALYLQMRDGSPGDAGMLALCLCLPCAAWFAGENASRATARALSAALLITSAPWTCVVLARNAAPQETFAARTADAVEALRTQKPGAQAPFLIAEDAQLASFLALHLSDKTPAITGHPLVYVVESPCATSQYAFWPRYDAFVDAPAQPQGASADPFTEQDGTNPFVGRSALYIATAPPELLPQAITAAFAHCRLLAEIRPAQGGVLRVYLCSDYQTLPL